MFIGHFGAALAAKKIDRRPSLGTLFMAAQWVDLVWPIFVLLGFEKVAITPGTTAFTLIDFSFYPFTHSLLSGIIWAVLFGGVYYLLRKNPLSALLLGGLVLSHWLFDLLVHRPDLPVGFGNNLLVGMGLWNSVAGTLIAEGLIFITGVALYLSVSHSLDRKGSMGLWGLLGFLVVIYLLNAFGPPPQSARAIGFAGLFQWLLVGWAYWADRHRNARTEMPVGAAKLKTTT